VWLIAGFLSVCYAGLITWIYKGWRQANESTVIPTVSFPGVSILIPVRNEENFIGQCIASILKCDYPKDKYEIIVIDDHSTDHTAEIVKSIPSTNLRFIRLASGLTGKKNAISTGIHSAMYDIILCTDGDSRVGSGWIASHSSLIVQGKNIRTGYVLPEAGDRLIEHFQWLDFAAAMAITANGIVRQKYFLANGANLCYSRHMFDCVGGFAGNETIASGDDIFLIKKMSKDDPHNTGFLADRAAIVTTKAESSWKALMHQRKRWAGKSLNSQDIGLKIVQVFIFTFVLVTFVSFLLMWIRWEQFGISFFILFFSKLVVDYIFLRKLTIYFNRTDVMRSYFACFLIYYVHILMSGFHALFPTAYQWKGRKSR